MNFEHGELTSLVDTAGNCNILNYDVMGNSATVPNPDPYLKGTADPTPACLFQFNLSDTAGNPIAAFAVVTPGPSWTFKLLPDKTAGGRAPAQLVGSATRAPDCRQRDGDGRHQHARLHLRRAWTPSSG